MKGTDIVVTGMGVVCPLGNSVGQLWQNILDKKCAAKHWDDLESEGFRTAIACRVTTDSIPQNEKRGQTMAVAAVQQALEQAQLPINQIIGLFTGTTMGESYAFEQAAEGKPFDLKKAAGSVFNEAIQQQFNTKGPKCTFGTACAAGNYAIGAAAEAIRSGRVSAAIAGGVDPFSRIAMVGFSRSRAMTPDLCRPFDANRNGMQLGEGAAYLVLETRISAEKRNATPLATIGALGLSCDAYHPTKPKEGGIEMANAMQNALANTNITVNEIGWICAHGSGTVASDAAEALAISQVFSNNNVWVSGLKGALGHSLGAATAIEAVICVKSLLYKTVPPTANHESGTDGLDIKVATESIHLPSLDWVLNCGYAFGGINSALVLGKG